MAMQRVCMSEARHRRTTRPGGAASTERIERRTIWEQAYAILRAQILDGRLATGTLLNLRDLADQLAVSVTPIRDAVLRLVAEGLIEDAGSHEFRVTQLSEEEIKQTLDLRILLEVYALEQSAPRRFIPVLRPGDREEVGVGLGPLGGEVRQIGAEELPRHQVRRIAGQEVHPLHDGVLGDDQVEPRPRRDGRRVVEQV